MKYLAKKFQHYRQSLNLRSKFWSSEINGMPEGLEHWKQHKKKEVALAKKFVETQNWQKMF